MVFSDPIELTTDDINQLEQWGYIVPAQSHIKRG